MIQNKELKRRIVEIAYKLKLGHIGSCLTAVDIIDEIYKNKKPDEKFVLSVGHAGLALYCVIEKQFQQGKMSFKLHPDIAKDMAERMFKHHGVHPDRCTPCGIDCSSGSLGHGIGIAVGMALADRTKNVYCLLSDGEMAEGSVWEALRIIGEQKLSNLKIYVNWNGWSAYQESSMYLYHLLKNLAFIKVIQTNMNDYPTWLQGQVAHYLQLNENQYNELMELLK